jgi:outer membrane protein OmpA-like peptidoglycan-associated protein
MPTSPANRMGYLHGGSTSVAFNLNRYVGLVADLGGYDNSRLTFLSPSGNQTVNADGSSFTYAFGPQFSYRKLGRFTPFAQALFGATQASPVTISGCSGSAICTPLGSENVFATVLGAGFDIQLSRHIALRPFEGDFLLTHFKNVSSAQPGWQDNVRFSAGIVFRFGGSAPPAPSAAIAASCSVDKDMVYAGSGDYVAVRAQASPDNTSLNYSWSASEGVVDGTGPEVRWSSSEKRPGLYTVRVRVDDGRDGTADCSASIRVEARPNRPPTINCSADRREVPAGDTVEITAVANDPDDDPVSFSWNASAGSIAGSGSSVRFPTAGLAPGSYAITGRADDGRRGTADCTVDVDVRAVPPQVPAEVAELETRLALHSIYFATARPTVANPSGGLVDSQRDILLALASDFNRYLTFKPGSHLILEGHADERGSVPFNQDLTERRVARAKGFLVEHGVPAGNIETRALGKQENLDAAQVKLQMEQNPELTDAERQRIESNLAVVILANNRRLDISLNTTGQQSVRRYPFNAKDALTLLRAKGDATGKPIASAAGAKP